MILATSRKSWYPVRYVPLLASGFLIFLGLMALGGLTGLLWHIRTYDWWIRLNPTIMGSSADWALWGLSFLSTISPAMVALGRRRTMREPTLMLTCFILPLWSLLAMTLSYHVGGILLIGAGFLCTYTLISQSRSLLGMDSRFVARVVGTEVFALLSITAIGGVIGVLLWGEDFIFALTSGSSLAPVDVWSHMLTVDLEVFYLLRPVLSALFIFLGVAAIVTLFREPFEWVTKSALRQFRRKDYLPAGNAISAASTTHRGIAVYRNLIPYAVLAASVGLVLGIALYPYVVADVHRVAPHRVVGSDSWFYVQSMSRMKGYGEDLLGLTSFILSNERGLFLLFLFATGNLTGLSVEWTVRSMPAILGLLLALSSFVLVKEGTGRLWLAAFAFALSVVSAQTALGMSAGILANWFSLSLANLMFALVVRSLRIRSKLAFLGSLMVSLMLLGSYVFMWILVFAEMLLVLLAILIRFWQIDRLRWRNEVGILSGIVLGSLLLPALALVVTMLFLGYLPPGTDPRHALTIGLSYLVERANPRVLFSFMPALEEALDFAGNRIDLPVLTVLSIIALLDPAYQSRHFARIMAAMITVPFAATLISPGLYETWRGLYVIPLYLTGALGSASVIRRVSGGQSIWNSRSSLGFAGTFTAYIFFSHLGYSLRALELLIRVSR